jgi:WhiB family transcriptional regulator, redox-sensing transcriptional regulator
MGGRDWRHQAACRDVDPDLFFPIGTAGPAQRQTARAKAVCTRCPVIADCLAFALVALPDGIAGGLTVTERAQLRSANPRCELGNRPAHDRRETAVRLRGRGWPATAIAKQLGINERSVYRLLKAAA